MTRLILLNGPPGIGKSTIGIRYATAHPLAFCLDVDLVRRSIGGWMDHPAESGLLSKAPTERSWTSWRGPARPTSHLR